MAVKDQINFLDRKIKQNKTDYDLYRQNAERSALSSGELDKYEYLTGKYLVYKPSPLQKAKFEYSPLGLVFNNGLKKDEKSEEILKRLKNIEDKTDNNNNSRAIEGQKDDGLKSIGYNFKQNLPPEALRVFNQIVEKEKVINYSYLYMNPNRRNTYDFRMFRKLKPLFEEIYFGHKAIDAIDRDQQLFVEELERLDGYRPRTEPNISNRRKILENANHFYEGRKMIIDAFKNRLFPMSDGNYYHRGDPEREDSSDSDNGNNGNNEGS